MSFDEASVLALTVSATKRYSDITCQRSHVDNSKPIIVTTPLFGALALVFFILRIISRCYTGVATWGLDDLVMIPTMVRLAFDNDDTGRYLMGFHH
jgi:hypothetical protein